MIAALILLLALALPHSLALAQGAASPPSSWQPAAAAQEAAPPAVPAAFDGRAYWARHDAEQATREAQQEEVDVRTPKIITLSLLAPAATLLLTAAINSLVEWSPVGPFDLLPSHSGTSEVREKGHVSPTNYWLAGAGGVLALGAIGTGLWWQRRVEQKRLKPGLGSAANETRLRGPMFSMRVGAASVGLVMSGRL